MVAIVGHMSELMQCESTEMKVSVVLLSQTRPTTQSSLIWKDTTRIIIIIITNLIDTRRVQKVMVERKAKPSYAIYENYLSSLSRP